MLLAVDIGNTNIVFGLYAGSELVQTFRIATVHTRTADEYGVLLQQLLALRAPDHRRVEASIIASVVPPLTDVMSEAISHAVARVPLVVGPGTKTGISVVYDHPRDVGADRIVNAVAAFERFKSGAIIVDFGTATTFDCVSDKGEYLGGAIFPGIVVAMDALFSRAAMLHRVELARPRAVIGRTTTQSIQSGMLYGYAGMVDSMVTRIRGELGAEARVIATGGLAGRIAGESATIERVEPFLTLEGLRLLFEKNRAPRAETPRKEK